MWQTIAVLASMTYLAIRNLSIVNKLLFIGFSIFLIAGCGASKTGHVTAEAIEQTTKFWRIENGKDAPFVTISEKAWYQDGMGITQICFINIVEDKISRSINVKTVGYRFLDLKKKWAYEYQNVSDTSAIRQKRKFTDTSIFVGGWNFAVRASIPVGSFQYLSDTLVGGLNHKKYKMYFSYKDTQCEALELFRCDKKSSVFQIDSAISAKIGCNLVYFRMSTVQNPHVVIEQEVKHISYNLPDSVSKVFRAWKRNEKEHPVE